MNPLITSVFLVVGLVNLGLTSAMQCLCDTDPVKTAFCNYKYSFRGTVMEINEVPYHPVDRFQRDVNPSYSYELAEPEELRPPAELSTRIVQEYRVRVDWIYRGVDKKHAKKEVVLYSERNERLCGNIKVNVGNGYLFQVDDMEWLSPCSRVIRFKELSKEERYGLRKLFKFTCKS